MSQIAAADNMLIETQSGLWRLLNSNGSTMKVSAEVTTETGLRYAPQFGSTRRLPSSGSLDKQHIVQVVLGWSQDDEAWHLGLILSPELTSVRGSRWCELVHWPDPDTQLFKNDAQQAGAALAETLSLPFHHLPPESAEVQVATPLPLLPLRFGWWTVEAGQSADTSSDQPPAELRLTRSRKWATSKLTRAGWYTLWFVIYVIVSVATLTSDLALPNAGTLLPNPQILPYLGLLIGLILLGMIAYQLYLVFSKPDMIVVDRYLRTVTAWRGNRQRWQIAGADVQSVYASEVVKKKDKTPTTYHGEINLHMGNGRFQLLIEQGVQETITNPNREVVKADDVKPLTSEISASDLQGTVLHIAEMLGDLPCWLDIRVK